jgi:two-component system LytT family response regulator
MINTILIDDEQNNIDNLAILLKKYCTEINIIATALNIHQAKELIYAHSPDLIFLDIQMPNGNGFDLLQSINNITFETIFATAFDQYGLHAIKFSALDYILKPISISDLVTAVKKATKRIEEKKQNSHIQNLLQFIKQPHDLLEHKIALPGTRETKFINVKNIIRCESSNSYTTFFTIDKEKITVSKSIREYEDLLTPYGFIRTHQSHLINRFHITKFIKEDGGFLIMADLSQIPIARQKKAYVKDVLSLS